MKEQATLSAAEITSDSVSEFTAKSNEDGDMEISDYSKGTKHSWERILENVMDVSSGKMTSDDTFQFHTGSVQFPKVNGKHNKHMQHVSLQAEGEAVSPGNPVSKMILDNILVYKEVLPGLESWKATKVASWHNLEGHSIQWFCVVSIDRTGYFLVFTLSVALTSPGFAFCECEYRNFDYTCF